MIGLYIAMSAVSDLPGEQMLCADDPVHTKVYFERGRFGGWPANHGMWSWGNEVVVGYSRGWYKNLGPTRHHIDREKPEEIWLARSTDGGETWSHEQPSRNGHLVPRGRFLHGTRDPEVALPPITDLRDPMEFTHAGFALRFQMTGVHGGESHFEYSYDRGHTWHGPFRLPNFDTPGTAPRTDYIVNGPYDAFAFITVAKDNGREGRPLCIRTTDGGLTWDAVSYIGPEPPGFAIMPSTVRVSEHELYTTLRRREGTFRWMTAWRSIDNGYSWTQEANPVDYLGEGNPPMLNALPDGRLCLTYGVRAYPFSICARLSEDNGKTWGPQIVLRNDGCDREVGYVRSAVRPDGKVVSVYYFNDEETGPERYIGATIWDPDRLYPITGGTGDRQMGF